MDNEKKNLSKMQQGAVTLLDILGWKGIWQRKSDAIEKLIKLIDKMEDRVSFLTNAQKNDRFKDLEVEVKSISDTIGLITYGEPDIALEFHALISSIIISSSILEEIPVRGATAYGYFTTKDNIMVGPAIDEVASWYEMTDWIGVIQTPSAMFQTSTQNFIFNKYEILSKYDVYIKGYGKINTYCSNWTVAWNWKNKHSKEDLLKCFLKMGPITPSISFKFMNTLKFYEDMMILKNSNISLQQVAASKLE